VCVHVCVCLRACIFVEGSGEVKCWVRSVVVRFGVWDLVVEGMGEGSVDDVAVDQDGDGSRVSWDDWSGKVGSEQVPDCGGREAVVLEEDGEDEDPRLQRWEDPSPLACVAHSLVSFLVWTVGYFGFMFLFVRFFQYSFKGFLLLPPWLGGSLLAMALIPCFFIGWACVNISFSREPLMASFSMLIDVALIASLDKDTPWFTALSVMLFMVSLKPVIYNLVAKAGARLNLDPRETLQLQWERSRGDNARERIIPISWRV